MKTLGYDRSHNDARDSAKSGKTGRTLNAGSDKGSGPMRPERGYTGVREGEGLVDPLVSSWLETIASIATDIARRESARRKELTK